MSDAKTEAMTKLNEILVKLDALAAAVAALKTAPRAAASSDGGAVFPNYGGAKGQPIKGAAQKDLEYYANGARRSLADPSKARFHDKERALLAAIEAELGPGEPPPMTDADAQPETPF